MDHDEELELRTRLVDAEEALKELVRVKDGPRSRRFRQEWALAWSRARAVLAQIPFHCLLCDETYISPCTIHPED